MRLAKILVVACVAAIALAFALQPPAGLSRDQAEILGLVLLTLSLWATSAVPGYVATLILFAPVLILGLAPPSTVFSGFSSAAIWLLVPGFVIGAAIRITGIGARIADLLRALFTGSYPRLIGGLTVVTTLLSFVMPSAVGRVVIMMPIAMALAEHAGFGQGSKGRTGAALATTFGCLLPSYAVLPSNLPNMVLAGTADTLWHLDFTYADYMLRHFPVLSLLKSLVVYLLILRFFPDRPAPTSAAETSEDGTPGKRPSRQIFLGLVLLVTLGFWTTDSLHHVNPAWIGLAAMAVLLLPKIGIVGPQDFKQAVDFGVLLYIAGLLAVGALVSESGLGTIIATGLIDLLPMRPDSPALDFASLSAMSFVTGLFTTMPGVPAVLSPLAGKLAEITGLGLPTVLMTQVIGFSTILFPYQSGPMIVGMKLAGEPVGAALRITIPLTVVTFLILLPIDYLYWSLAGWL